MPGSLKKSKDVCEPISCSIQGSNCCFLTRIQVSQETGNMARYSHPFKSLLQFIMIPTVKGFSVVDETEVDVFLELPSFVCDPANGGNLISDSSSFSKPSLDGHLEVLGFHNAEA